MNRALRLALLLLLSDVLFPSTAYTQFTRHYPAASFLKAEQVYHVKKDKKGFLWFSTDNGVARYDGKKMLHFTTTQGIPDNTVFDIYEDRQGRIWLFTYNGQYCFIKNGQVHHSGNDTFLKRLPRCNSYINCITETDNAEIYFGFFSGDLLCVQDMRARWVFGSASAKSCICMITAHKKQVTAYFADGYGDIVQGSIRYRQSKEKRNLFCNNGYWISSDATGIKVYKDGKLTRAIKDERYALGTLIHAYVSQSGLLFCSTSHGLEVVDLQKLSSQLLFKDIKITSCTEDLAGNYWITTYDNGVYMLHHELNAIKKIPVPGDLQKVWAQDGTIYFTSSKTLYSLSDTATSVFAHALLSPFETYYNLLHADNEYCFYDNVWKNTLYERYNNMSALIGNWGKKIYSPDNRVFFVYGSNATSYFTRQQHSWKVAHRKSFTKKISAAAQDPVSKNVFFICNAALYQCDFKQTVSNCILQDSILANIRDIYAFDTTVIATTNAREIYLIHFKERKPVLTVLKTPFIIHEIAFIKRNVYLIRTDDENYIATVHKDGFTFRQLMYPFSSSDYEHIYPYKGHFIIKTENGLYSFAGSLINKAYFPPRLFFNGLTINGTHYNDTSITIKNIRRLDIHITPGILSFGSNDRTIQYRIIDENQAHGTIQTQKM